jgi:hypothetical protein
MGDRVAGLDAHCAPVAVLGHQWSITVDYGSRTFSWQKDDSVPPSPAAQSPLLHFHHPRLLCPSLLYSILPISGLGG